MKKNIRRILIALFIGASVFIGINLFVLAKARPYTQASDRSAYVAIVLGARVYPSGRLSPMLEDRVLTALELYQQGRVKRILVSGDNGRPDYDEVSAMKDYLLAAGVPAGDIFLDHAGFDTYDSLYRAKHIFQVDTAIIVTQEFHLPRAVYIARSLGMAAVGMAADKRPYASIRYNKLREWPSRVKAFFSVSLRAKPRYLGEAIPIFDEVSWPVSYKFADFPAEEIHKGEPAQVNFVSNPLAQAFYTRIVEGAAKGPNFAGKYTVIEWGCGTSCQSHAIVDAQTGAIVEYGLPSSDGVEYRLDSNLFVVNPPQNFSMLPVVPDWLKTEYFDIKSGHLKLLETM